MGKKAAPKVKRDPATEPGVTIRMYCQGLGDCFLLTFRPAGGDPVRVLIDCGVLQRTPGEAEKMRAVAENLREETGGRIDLLVVTHEHWDHVAGFSDAQDVFEQIEFGRVWLSWAENPDDPDARAVKADLGKKRKKVQAALRAARARLGARGDDPAARRLDDELRQTEALFDFFGPGEPSAGPGPAAAAKDGERRMTLGETMDWLREKVRPGGFCSPGERRPLPGVDGANVYVLGPPRSVAGIRKMDPSGDQGYHKHRAARVSLLGALEALEDGDVEVPGPFEDRYRVRPEHAAADPFFREFYGFADDPLGDAGMAWRRIDDEWLGGISRLALQLDTGVNNTSLALAFELPDGRTLIFPGDAQAGNWASWDALQFKGPARGEPVTAKQLLNRAVFYKVGHHGSHNATRKVGGLYEMTGGDLVAMIPTDEAFALKQSPPRSWQMPFADLYTDLKAYTHQRVLRADRGADELDAAAEAADSPAAWRSFVSRVRYADETLPGTDLPLYVEYTIPT